MKESYGEGFANHTSLESCGDCSNALAEALTEGSTGGLLSCEITTSRVPTLWFDGEGNTFYSVMRVVNRPGGVIEPGMCGHSLRGNREVRESSLKALEMGDPIYVGFYPRSCEPWLSYMGTFDGN